LKSLRHSAGRVAAVIADIEIGAIAARDGMPSAHVTLASGLKLRRDHAIGKTPTVKVEIIAVATIYHAN
jgi:acid phosphatase family membrane protein YuiD